MPSDDLDEQFALFQSQIQKVSAKRPKPKSKPQSVSLPSSSSALAPAPLTVADNVTPSPNRRPTLPQKSPPLSPRRETSSQPAALRPAPATGRWSWDGSAWKWLAAPVPSTSRSLPGRQQGAPLRAAPSTPPSSHNPSLTVSHPDNLTPPRLSTLPRSTPSATPPAALVKRAAAGEVWKDPTLAEWPSDDHRIFVGDLAPDASEADLEKAFTRYPSFNMARVVRDKRSGLCKGYGFVSFAAGEDMIAALREMNGKYVGTRPVKLKKSTWQKRNLSADRRRELKLFKEIAKRK